MTDESAGTKRYWDRRPYVKPFIRNLDASDTEGKDFTDPSEFQSYGGARYAPS